MPELNPAQKTYQKNRVDLAVDGFAKLEKPTIADLNKVGVIGQVQAGIDAYRTHAKNMQLAELENEKHNSSRLASHMSSTGDPRPHSLCDAHAIISGNHAHAARLRAVLAWFQIRIDDPHNGCWLPRNSAAKKHMPERLQNAVAHSRIHRKKYYEWLDTLVSLESIYDENMLIQKLTMIELKLQTSTFPARIMLPNGIEQ